MRNKQFYIDMIEQLMTLKNMGYTKQFIECELRECKNMNLKKVYRKYQVISKQFKKVYPEYV